MYQSVTIQLVDTPTSGNSTENRPVFKAMNHTTDIEGGKARVRTVTIDSDYAGQRVDNYLIRELRGVPRSRVYRIIRKGEVRVNGKRVKAHSRLAPGDRLRIPPVHLGPAVARLNPIENIDKTIIYENKFVLVINKRAGIAVHGGSGISSGVIESLRDSLPMYKLELVHRLDRDTSGCLMIAKSRPYLRRIQQALRERSGLAKYYQVVVHGRWPKRKTRIDAPILKSVMRGGERFSRVSFDGKDSSTGFRVLAARDGCSLLEAQAITGRTHQIRVHCQHAGFPVVGDDKYGDADADSRLARGGTPGRLMLHASRLEVPRLDEFPGFSIEAVPDDRFQGFADVCSS